MTILHLLYTSIPDITGSSTRSKNIVDSQKAIGLNPIVISSPFQAGSSKIDMYDEVKYYRTNKKNSKKLVISEKEKSLFTKIRKVISIVSFVYEIYKIAKVEKPDIIHAHSTFFMGLSGIFLSKLTGVKIIYEVRSLWEERKLINNKKISKKIEVIIIKFLEKLCMSKSDYVICINEILKQYLLDNYNLNSKKLIVIKNAVDEKWIKKQCEKIEYRKTEKLTFGYVGSLSPIEGLEKLIECFSLSDNLKQHNLYIFGNGSKKYINKLNFNSKNIHFKGSLCRDDINQAYSLIDIVVIPRVASLLTNTVTPLKPIEAGALSKLVLVSDIPPMRELITENNNGLFFSHEKNNLEEKLVKIIDEFKDLNRYKTFTLSAQKYILTTFSWKENAQKLKCLYESLIISKN